jgi:NADH pyrophosphatase NudC (nudix superfamily)
MAYAFALVGTAALGFSAGLLSFKVKSRWCPQCGATTADLAHRQLIGRQP